MPKIDNVIFMLGAIMLLPWSLIAYIVWLFCFKPREKQRSYGRIDLNNVPHCTIETSKQFKKYLQ